ncbi:Molybdenum ABC transporter, periplasmic molybdenum-binding protein ModA [Lunatimonas lonarensis]|uniref:Molybdenum ABC transporter, periplasmic molybdenum-binding protein ModA n=1 Tax=Lunatimonas lonarensis TaxID=1232681 RepID=R7ZTB0_9BACT|nr:molybdate ABC transporter substrate-binding protein [Lunatimonas lonarensis]EON77386.1 Molybdenum ABC transporter, periplasmic molybdenum-binding protein ModA [Lunatimonas lonarensis]
MKRPLLTLGLFVLLTLPLVAQRTASLRVAAASDLKFALDSVISTYIVPGIRIDPIYGSSGKLFEQISNGAPFDIFLSADVKYPKELIGAGHAVGDPFVYAVGRLVLWSKNVRTDELGMDALRSPTIKKVAIANPRHAPYGEKAVEALRNHGLYELLLPKLVYGENISQAAQFVSSGAADIGLIALSLAKSPTMSRLQPRYFLVPEDSHQPLIQAGVITRYGKDKEAARQFFDYLKGERAVAILQHFGFSKPL